MRLVAGLPAGTTPKEAREVWPRGGIIVPYHLCVCDALVGIKKWVLGQAYPDTANIREAELEALLHSCQNADFL